MSVLNDSRIILSLLDGTVGCDRQCVRPERSPGEPPAITRRMPSRALIVPVRGPPETRRLRHDHL